MSPVRIFVKYFKKSQKLAYIYPKNQAPKTPGAHFLRYWIHPCYNYSRVTSVSLSQGNVWSRNQLLKCKLPCMETPLE